eukprot:2112363-Amphidinium_carterae.1
MTPFEKLVWPLQAASRGAPQQLKCIKNCNHVDRHAQESKKMKSFQNFSSSKLLEFPRILKSLLCKLRLVA